MAAAGISVEEFLAHHGVKGMHWGTHLQKSLDLHTKIASGNGSRLDKLRARAEMSAIDIARHKGSVESYSKEQAANLQARHDRFHAGNETAADKVARLATYTAIDFAKASRNKKRFAAANHDDAVGDFLEHHGVKGMKWGVRRDRGHEGERVKTSHLDKLDKKHNKQYAGIHGWVKVQNEFAGHINPMLNELNNNPKYKGKIVLGGHNAKLRDEYLKDYEKVFDKAAHMTSESLGLNPSGTRKIVVSRSGTGEYSEWTARFEDVTHADNAADVICIVKPIFDSTGHIVGQTFINPADRMQQDDAVGVFLSHFGVKGMHWGIRKDQARAAGTHARAAAEGLANDPTKKQARTKVRDAGGLHKVSDKQLKEMLNRMDMERRYNQAMKEDADRRREGLKAVGRFLEAAGKILVPVAVAAATTYATGTYRTHATTSRTIEGTARALGA